MKIVVSYKWRSHIEILGSLGALLRLQYIFAERVVFNPKM
jgi:hypothetical protein